MSQLPRLWFLFRLARASSVYRLPKGTHDFISRNGPIHFAFVDSFYARLCNRLLHSASNDFAPAGRAEQHGSLGRSGAQAIKRANLRVLRKAASAAAICRCEFSL